MKNKEKIVCGDCGKVINAPGEHFLLTTRRTAHGRDVTKAYCSDHEECLERQAREVRALRKAVRWANNIFDEINEAELEGLPIDTWAKQPVVKRAIKEGGRGQVKTYLSTPERGDGEITRDER